MKPTMNKNDLLNKADIWNAVIDVLTDHELTTEMNSLNEAILVYQYYSELESGGHESLYRWLESFIREVGIQQYLSRIIDILEKNGANDYAAIEKKYGQEMWDLYVALENEEIDEEKFYHVIEKADNEYYNLEGKLEGYLEEYFAEIYTDLIEVV
ncbi:hypothetical protein [Bacillus sp. PS06]|uniref:DMP19 family protein n=1 Tax=Bacillus sp. PS06 TaxID=2764176 RepID=UPI00178401E2|nr:hypothetical protein [Bacillus sp. PS06]MBD8067824.1 hypothetical protein [Bacillus sp. PS06]